MSEANEILTVTVSATAYGGAGIARHEGMVIFVHGTLPGESAEVRLVRRRKNYAEAALVRVLSPSPHRITPACPLHGSCPGCRYQHCDYPEEVRLKNAQFVDLLSRLGGLSAAPVLDPSPAPQPLGYRNRITLHSGRDGERRYLGYFAEDNRTVLEVTSCPIAAGPINAALGDYLRQPPREAPLPDGTPIAFRWTAHDGTLHWAGPCPPDGPWLTEQTALGPLAVPRGSFFQVNPDVASALLAEAESAVRAASPNFVIDLYCGVGAFALAAARAGVPEVLGIDSDPEAIRAATQNARTMGLAHVHFASAPADRALKDVLRAADKTSTLLIVDPPRAGLTDAVKKTLRAHPPARVLYVSCAADTLARDLKELVAAGYGVVRTRLFDMFPRTALFESVTLLAFGKTA